MKKCEDCDGTGLLKCGICNGTGIVTSRSYEGLRQESRRCVHCMDGYVYCPTCRGTGEVPNDC